MKVIIDGLPEEWDDDDVFLEDVNLPKNVKQYGRGQ